MKGQLESSFQWIFVLVAGSIFLILFGLLARGCVQATETKTTGLSVSTAATRLTSLAWQPTLTTEVSLIGDLSCPAGTLTLTHDSATASIDAPTFLPPSLNGRSEIETQQLALTATPSIPLGNVLYAYDADTVYLILAQGTFEHGTVIPATAQDTLASHISSTTKTLVLLTAAGRGYIENAALDSIPATVDVRGVAREGNEMIFFERRNGIMKSTGAIPYLHEALAIGAFVSADIRNFACARAEVIERMRALTVIYEQRTQMLLDRMPTNTCTQFLEAAQTLLEEMNTKNNAAYIDAVFAPELPAQQSALTYASCPVIA
ncbi:MAG: hypothetical protein OXR66_06080 [Candidatus Woesearchaeota archaeon]|nr:hypothetical protein [Candidatus Woesearchaeota archaeon]